MFSKLALTIVAALVSLQGVAAAPAVPTCPSGRNAYCCAVVFPGGDLAASCSTYTGDCSGQVSCCVYKDAFQNGYGCSAPNDQ